ncbi:hypothetical protein BCEN4_1150017 [Burkholderia cenocepacia]|nr:hypothetical protein BCEN4_1150017 [Burkholderia cenocepacia]
MSGAARRAWRDLQACRAAVVTCAIKRCAINDLGRACSGYPHACQQKLWTSPRAAAPGATCALVPRLKQRGQSLSDQALGRGMRRLSTRLPTQSVDKHGGWGGRRGVTRRDGTQPTIDRPRAAFEAARTKSFGSSA